MPAKKGTKALRIYVTESELASIHQIAASRNLTISRLVRDLLAAEIGDQWPNDLLPHGNAKRFQPARCAICSGEIDRERPFVVYGRNPRTFRMAWMHELCAIDEREALTGKPSRNPIYQDRKDEYDQRFK